MIIKVDLHNRIINVFVSEDVKIDMNQKTDDKRQEV